nr:S-norcoclaurine synthase 2-like [Tanacetum cinerariifolium]
MGSYTLKQLKKMYFDEIKELFEATKRSINDFVPMESEDDKAVPKLAEARSLKRDAEEELEHKGSNKQKTSEASRSTQEQPGEEEKELSQKDLQQLMIIVSEQGMKDDLGMLWSLVKERFSLTKPTNDKERVLWVELKRLFEPDTEDELWELQRVEVSTARTEVKVPASKAWALYGTLELVKLVVGKTVDAIDVLEGNGGVGTILKLTLKPGLGFTHCKEKFTEIDHENKVKEVKGVEGGFLDLGFNFYRVRFEIKDNPNDETDLSCIVKLTIEYDVKEEFVANASLLNTDYLIGIMTVANEHLLKTN